MLSAHHYSIFSRFFSFFHKKFRFLRTVLKYGFTSTYNYHFFSTGLFGGIWQIRYNLRHERVFWGEFNCSFAEKGFQTVFSLSRVWLLGLKIKPGNGL
ncbi:MAG: hypothetical protein A3H57_00210 [Candidatus Taylorbacteria bacterium RIFCSPLOWO2_02_FULL_43_11]|uniref:Uncharacterized protein n=1 Tax=Candidatus Taylorbacteria bacterium RIFCSPHIGHO2_02_FULL_43_32b TaxID=1802306 RepID=A0A1G2MFN1_9BACT|nr:MAG: hypothetical protein A2743_00645 [Candidatus Taylorbacteria bacterium RIFCSPHIGHO2_01_FULL_43_47]OHA22514.1 MAG: hypothetical protein A3C72_00260 [Candidatus Taylorbacteria bacterium RIFCSPHIGHO2_02_FULL_43_32b]OHA29420.1 MAG: hypothetical protein A3B08_03905 [Candidatus Taylorbacteria bacterium RIFCSPLOWO2_01_FULL_43_44]OHA35897.1 MAG: hypothetical protein A3H57_00210 [Candidatus Taylorbacteria bacterium RIFCSPLOWO2_02_FULL_43_11]